MTNNWIYIVLGLILILPVTWQVYGSEEIRKWHPFFDVEYSLYWYLGLSNLTVIPFLYSIVAILAKRKHRTLLICFVIYEFTMVLDHFLIYSQSNVRAVLSILLMTYMVWYHYKYEPHR